MLVQHLVCEVIRSREWRLLNLAVPHKSSKLFDKCIGHVVEQVAFEERVQIKGDIFLHPLDERLNMVVGSILENVASVLDIAMT